MNIKILTNYCFTNSQRKWETAESLLKSKRYADCLFFCHLTLEFILKGKVAKANNKMFPIIHDLQDLANKAGISLDAQQKKELAVINTFNIASRYDDYKSSFYKTATPAYTKRYYQTTKKLYLWLKNQPV
ncbi:HEPN domain-containing protein [Patescibacteria group bacterium]|nr:HEPN domain-containing protein [Patescibacteria group bacterium]MBU4512050.1 HEPN domain-containing protein [Patescibacteria group bacterium]MCG2693235.1 HEPN domain-containing protein [Candidatus Parcubacteria bacterium]